MDQTSFVSILKTIEEKIHTNTPNNDICTYIDGVIDGIRVRETTKFAPTPSSPSPEPLVSPDMKYYGYRFASSSNEETKATPVFETKNT